ncbi:hypothetical protein GCM10027596_06240 [Nocardioides korecus]
MTPGALTPEGLVAAVLAGLGASLLVPARRSRGPGPSTPRRPLPPLLVVAAVGLGAVVLWSSVDGHAVVLVVEGLVVLGAVLRLVRRGRRARVADARSEQVQSACDAMASDLAVGQPPLQCLDRAAREWAELAPVAVAARMGADVPAALRELAELPGARQLRTVAATWQVAQSTGAGLAAALARAADSIRAERRTTRLVAAELSAAHATARMLAVLPVGVLLLGAGVGGDPVGFLTGTTAGLVCLGLGLGLSLGGLTWIERIADRVLRR